MQAKFPDAILKNAGMVSVHRRWSNESEKRQENRKMVDSVSLYGLAGAIIIQLLLAVNLRLVLGETLIALVGGIVYAFLMVHNGIWDKGLSQREALWRDFLTSVICAGIFSVLYGICLGRMGATEKQTIYLSLLFLGGITIVAFIVLRVLSYFNRKRRRISVNGEQRDIPTSKLGCTKIYNAKDIVEAGRIVELLKEHGIAAFPQEAGASVSMHGASGFGMYGMDWWKLMK